MKPEFNVVEKYKGMKFLCTVKKNKGELNLTLEDMHDAGFKREAKVRHSTLPIKIKEFKAEMAGFVDEFWVDNEAFCITLQDNGFL